MSGNVVDLPGRSTVVMREDSEPVPDVIERLEDMLARARAGRIRAFAATLVEAPCVTSSLWATGEGGWYQEITAGLSTLQYRWLSAQLGPG